MALLVLAIQEVSSAKKTLVGVAEVLFSSIKVISFGFLVGMLQGDKSRIDLPLSICKARGQCATPRARLCRYFSKEIARSLLVVDHCLQNLGTVP